MSHSRKAEPTFFSQVWARIFPAKSQAVIKAENMTLKAILANLETYNELNNKVSEAYNSISIKNEELTEKINKLKSVMKSDLSADTKSHSELERLERGLSGAYKKGAIKLVDNFELKEPGEQLSDLEDKINQLNEHYRELEAIYPEYVKEITKEEKRHKSGVLNNG